MTCIAHEPGARDSASPSRWSQVIGGTLVVFAAVTIVMTAALKAWYPWRLIVYVGATSAAAKAAVALGIAAEGLLGAMLLAGTRRPFVRIGLLALGVAALVVHGFLDATNCGCMGALPVPRAAGIAMGCLLVLGVVLADWMKEPPSQRQVWPRRAAVAFALSVLCVAGCRIGNGVLPELGEWLSKAAGASSRPVVAVLGDRGCSVCKRWMREEANVLAERSGARLVMLVPGPGWRDDGSQTIEVPSDVWWASLVGQPPDILVWNDSALRRWDDVGQAEVR